MSTAVLLDSPVFSEHSFPTAGPLWSEGKVTSIQILQLQSLQGTGEFRGGVLAPAAGAPAPASWDRNPAENLGPQPLLNVSD